jgi:acetyl esterase/lipase
VSTLFSKRLTAWQTVVVAGLWLYLSRNFGKLVGLECPEPLANLYSRSYFRATWVTTALDAGFWTAMTIRPRWLKDVMSIVFTVYYLICAEQADEKVRKVRGLLTLEHLRVSWNKGETPYLRFASNLLRPRFMRYKPRQIRIPRPHESSYKNPVNAWLYFDGPIAALKGHTKIVLDVPGGGFVAMSPRTHDDKLMAWASKTGLPILSLDYRKAPEYPYPYALNECYDAYYTIIATRGRCLGLSGETSPKIVISGDSAGGNLAVGTVLMILQASGTNSRRWHGETGLPLPEALVLVYPALDMNIGNWMTDEQMALIRDRKMRKTNKAILRRKSDDYHNLTAPNTPHHSDEEPDEDDATPAKKSPQKDSSASDSERIARASISNAASKLSLHPSAAHIPSANSRSPAASASAAVATTKPRTLKTRLAMSSMISYFNDRILAPEMMRSMIILYIGPHNRPDFSTDFLLSPLLAPESLLARFPKTYFLTGERDPLVDDTVIFAGRLRLAHANALLERKELGLEKERREFRDEDFVEVVLVPGISHGFLNFVGVFPEGWKYVFRAARWITEVFEQSDARGPDYSPHYSCGPGRGRAAMTPLRRDRHHRRMRTESSGDEDRPLEMSTISVKSATSKSPKQNGSPKFPPANRSKVVDGRVEKETTSPVERRERAARRRRSLVSLASEDDLLGRRMKGLTSGLIDMDAVPPTP